MNILAAVACDRRAVLIAAAGDIDNDGLVFTHGRRELHRVRDSVCRLDRRNDTLDTAEVLECIYRFVVRHRNKLIQNMKWKEMGEFERIKAIYNYVRDDVLFGYNIDDGISASKVLADGYGQCNTKGTLFMALLRAWCQPVRKA